MIGLADLFRSRGDCAAPFTRAGSQAPDYVEDPTYAEHRDRWRHAVATVIEWHGRYGMAAPSPVPPADGGARSRNRSANRRARKVKGPRAVNQRDYEMAVDLATDWYELDAIRVGLRTGDMGIRRREGSHIWVSNHRLADVEVLDILLGFVTLPAPASGLAAEPDPVVNWFKLHSVGSPDGGIPDRHPHAHRLLNGFPGHLRTKEWDVFESALARQGTTLADDTDIGGLTFAQARLCYSFLLSQLHLNELGAFYFGTPEMNLWAIQPAHLTHALATRVGREAAEIFVGLLTFRVGRSPLSAPLLPHAHQLLVPSEIVSPIAFERTLLRAASSDPATSGALGNLLGKRSGRWAQRLLTVPGCEVGEEILVKDAAGRTVGDLDVVVWDQEQGVMVIFETKWPVDAATLVEGGKVEAQFDKGIEQLRRLQQALQSGTAHAAWPRTWTVPPRLEGIDTSWWVGSAQQLDSRAPLSRDSHGAPGADGRDDVAAARVGTTSLRLVENLLPADNLSDLLTRLESFPLPSRGVEYDFQARVVRAGPWSLHYDAIALHGEPPKPPPDRRIHNGWT